MSFDVINFSTNIIRKCILKRKAANSLKKMKEIKKFVIKNMKDVQEKQLNVVNVHRKNVKYEIKNLI